MRDPLEPLLHQPPRLATSKQGNLYKAIDGDADFTRFHASDYEKKEGTPEQGQGGAFDDLKEFISWVSTAPTQSALSRPLSGLRTS